jgi:hypothetical protein
MNPILKKMNLKEGSEVFIQNFPDDLSQLKQDLISVSKLVVNDLKAADNISFTIVFTTKQSQIDEVSPQIAESVKGDAIVWFVYPKGTSKRYKCEFNRDNGWNILGKLGFEGVRMVAIDEDWSALRFRRVEFMKKITRDDSRRLTK